NRGPGVGLLRDRQYASLEMDRPPSACRGQSSPKNFGYYAWQRTAIHWRRADRGSTQNACGAVNSINWESNQKNIAQPGRLLHAEKNPFGPYDSIAQQWVIVCCTADHGERRSGAGRAARAMRQPAGQTVGRKYQIRERADRPG